ncbi:MAG: hypothetical protein AB1646_18260 [Thermodesulfobacteriota bacterium]
MRKRTAMSRPSTTTGKKAIAPEDVISVRWWVVAAILGATLIWCAAGSTDGWSQDADVAPRPELAEEQNEPEDAGKTPEADEPQPAKPPHASGAGNIPVKQVTSSRDSAKPVQRNVRRLNTTIKRMNITVDRIRNVERRLSIPRRHSFPR